MQIIVYILNTIFIKFVFNFKYQFKIMYNIEKMYCPITIQYLKFFLLNESLIATISLKLGYFKNVHEFMVLIN